MGSWLPATAQRHSTTNFFHPHIDSSDLVKMANSTLMFSGINPEGRNSSKVLRPPGGGSSLGSFADDSEPVAKPQQQMENVEKSEEAPAATENQNTTPAPPAAADTEEAP